MSKEESRPQEVKQPKTVQVKLLVPYAIIVVMFITFVSIVFGWNLREDMNQKVNAEVSSLTDKLSKTSK